MKQILVGTGSLQRRAWHATRPLVRRGDPIASHSDARSPERERRRCRCGTGGSRQVARIQANSSLSGWAWNPFLNPQATVSLPNARLRSASTTDMASVVGRTAAPLPTKRMRTTQAC